MTASVVLRRRKLLYAAATVVAVLLVGLAGAAWYYAGEVQSGAFEINREENKYPLLVSELADGTVTLELAMGPDDLDLPGWMGLETARGYAQAGPVTTRTNGSVTRPVEPVRGQLSHGDRARYDRSAFSGNPQQALGLEFSEVKIPGPLGEMSAWLIHGAGSTWIIAVHGRTADRAETLRFISSTRDWNMPTVAISYRNDEGEPQDPSGEYRFGITEWEDLDAAVRYAVDGGAERIILAGFSMGGGIIAHYLDRGEHLDLIAGLVLDAPMLNLTSALNLAARQRGVPQPVPFLAAWVSTMRFGVSWGKLDTREILHSATMPVLLFHGTDDDSIPVTDSRTLSSSIRSGRVTYVEVPGAVHAGAWNVDPEHYEEAIDEWLATNVFAAND